MPQIRKKLSEQFVEEQFKNTTHYRGDRRFSKKAREVQLITEIRRKWREELLKDKSKNTPRYRRARRFSNDIMHLLFDFLPGDRTCLRLIEEHLTQTAFNCNLEIVEVAYDELGQADHPACASECCTDPT